MICYFDTSAFVPLLITEPTTATCLELWTASETVVTNRITYVEAAAALAQAERMSRISASAYVDALRQLDLLWSDFTVIEVDGPLCARAAYFAYHCELRGYDAVHLAAIEQAASPELVAASGDKKLQHGCIQIGVNIAEFRT